MNETKDNRKDEILLAIKDLTAGYNSVPAIKNVSFELKAGEIIAIMGPNGAGKSTILRSILGFTRIMAGEIWVNGHNALKEQNVIRRMIGYVPQREFVSQRVPIKAKDIVLSAILLRRGPLSIPTKRDMITVKRVLERVGLPRAAWFKRFDELSGGQQQKVLIARALVGKPKILLLDEPFSAVDIKSLREIMALLVELKAEGAGIILVVHDINEIIEHIDKILLINREMVAFDVPQRVLAPDNLRRAYGADIEVLYLEGKCIALIGDKHA